MAGRPRSCRTILSLRGAATASRGQKNTSRGYVAAGSNSVRNSARSTRHFRHARARNPAKKGDGPRDARTKMGISADGITSTVGDLAMISNRPRASCPCSIGSHHTESHHRASHTRWTVSRAIRAIGGDNTGLTRHTCAFSKICRTFSLNSVATEGLPISLGRSRWGAKSRSPEARGGCSGCWIAMLSRSCCALG